MRWVEFLTEIRDFFYKDSILGKKDKKIFFACKSDKTVSTSALGIFYARVNQSNAACRVLISIGYEIRPCQYT